MTFLSPQLGTPPPPPPSPPPNPPIMASQQVQQAGLSAEAAAAAASGGMGFANTLKTSANGASPAATTSGKTLLGQ